MLSVSILTRNVQQLCYSIYDISFYGDSHLIESLGAKMAGHELFVDYTVPERAQPNDNHRDDIGHAALSVFRDLNRRPQSAAKIVVFANEKGGVGKSTLAFHCCAALCNAGYRVAAIDLDSRQRTFA